MSVASTVPSRDDLLASFYEAAKPKDAWRVGIELERHLLQPDGSPLPYAGERGVADLIGRFVAEGWSPYFEDGNLVSAKNADGGWITLEPGNQFEYSGPPFKRLAAMADDARRFTDRLDVHLEGSDTVQVALGYTPFTPVDAITWVPKGRYVVMREHLARTGELAHDMMKATCAFQASFDFSDEADAAAKVGLGTRLGPLTTAMLANSPIRHGAPSGFVSFRGHVWTQTDPARTGFPEAAAAFRFERWLDYLLDVPMMFHKDDRGWRAARGATFRDWMRDGIEGRFPTLADWELHQTSVFPELRVKKYIEVRGADCVQLDLGVAFSAWLVGIFYDDEARGLASEVAARFASFGSPAERFEIAVRGGLVGEVGGRRLSAWAEELVDIGAAGLQRWAPSDRPLIEPLIAQVATGESPGHAALRAFQADPTPAGVRRAFRYR